MSEQTTETAHRHECAIAPHPPMRNVLGRGMFGCYCVCGAIPLSGEWVTLQTSPPGQTGGAR